MIAEQAAIPSHLEFPTMSKWQARQKSTFRENKSVIQVLVFKKARQIFYTVWLLSKMRENSGFQVLCCCPLTPILTISSCHVFSFGKLTKPEKNSYTPSLAQALSFAPSGNPHLSPLHWHFLNKCAYISERILHVRNTHLVPKCCDLYHTLKNPSISCPPCCCF